MENKEKITISSISTKTGKTAPIIATLLNGEILPSDKIKCHVKRDSNNSIETMKITTDQGVKYSNIENSTNDDFRTFIAIRNKTTNKMRLIELEQVVLKPMVKDKEKEEITAIDSQNRRSKRIDLDKAFGTKRSRVLIERRSKMQTNVDLQKEQLENTAGSRSISEIELGLTQDQDNVQHFSDCLPPCNRNASTAGEVYFLGDIINEEELNSLSETAEKIIQNRKNLSEEYNFSLFFIACLNAIPSANENKNICLLLYAEALLKIANLKNMRIYKKQFRPCYSEIVNNKIITEFTNLALNECIVPNHYQDKALCYIFVILFHIFNFNVDLGWLMTSYSKGLKRLKDLMRVVGGSSNSKLKNLYILKVPLPELPSVLKREKKNK